MDIATLGEFGLIARLTEKLATRSDVVLGVGDDCAVLDLKSDTLLLTTCDSQVESVHFTLQISKPEQIGRKALAINLSDIAAMGGKPCYALISLILPARLPLEILDGIYAGLRQEAQQYETTIVGGNIAAAGKSEQLVIDISLLGTASRGHVLTRDNAQVGDTLFVTGSLGDSAAGFSTFTHADRSYPPDALEFVHQRHCTPQPRVREGLILGQFGPRIVTAMLDISDGLSGDLGHICERSGVGASLDVWCLPISQAMHTIAASLERDPLAWALHGGEDYELLFTVSPGHEQSVIDAVRSATGTPITAIGTVRPSSEGVKLVFADGREERLQTRSWDHLKDANSETGG